MKEWKRDGMLELKILTFRLLSFIFKETILQDYIIGEKAMFVGFD